MSNVSVMLDKKLTSYKKEVLERFKEFQEAIIKKDAETLNEIMDDDYILTHMSGKTQTKAEYISELMDGTLNYYKSTIIHPQISIFEENYAKIIADIELDAKVYGIKGTWTLNTNISMKKINNNWFLNQWEN